MIYAIDHDLLKAIREKAVEASYLGNGQHDREATFRVNAVFFMHLVDAYLERESAIERVGELLDDARSYLPHK